MAATTAASIARRAARVRMVALDVDGVLTDGRLYFGPRGEALKAFDVRDGFGIRLLQEEGIEVAIVTGRSSRIVAARARDLGIDKVLQGQADKGAALARLLAQAGVAAQDCAYMGDDWPDLPAFGAVGLAATVADAHEEIKRLVHWVAPSAGGRGAVRDLARLLLRARGRYDGLLRAAADGAPSRAGAPRARTATRATRKRARG